MSLSQEKQNKKKRMVFIERLPWRKPAQEKNLAAHLKFPGDQLHSTTEIMFREPNLKSGRYSNTKTIDMHLKNVS